MPANSFGSIANVRTFEVFEMNENGRLPELLLRRFLTVACIPANIPFAMNVAKVRRRHPTSRRFANGSVRHSGSRPCARVRDFLPCASRTGAGKS